MTDSESYRTSHASTGYGDRYDANYASGYYAAVYRDIEVPMLRKLFSDMSTQADSLLDFACGTARITRLATPHFSEVVGVDVSESMLANARTQSSANFICQDITQRPLDRQFDVVTAFRFFLNAEDQLRRDALEAIKGHLRPEGRLICNIHMNADSPMGVVYRLVGLIPRAKTHNTLSLKRFEKTLNDAGFSVEKVIWYARTPRPSHYFGGFLDRHISTLERILGAVGFSERLSHSFIVVASHSAPLE